VRASLHPLRYCLPAIGLMAALPAQAENTYTFTLGGGFTPRYQGSKEYRGVVAPGFSAEFGNGWFISTMDGAGYHLDLPHGTFVSAAINYAGGRKDSNRFGEDGSDYLKGMGNIPGSVILSVQAGVKVFGENQLSVTLDTPLTHTTRGVSGHVDLAVPLFKSAQHLIVVTGTVHAGSGRYTQTFYGVTDAQSMSSRFRPYSTKGGVDSTSMGLAWTYDVSKHWSVTSTAGVTRLLGDYGNSPIVQSKTNYYGFAAVSYRF
jgi:MipA family protein